MIKNGMTWSGLFLALSLVVTAFGWFQIPADAVIAVPWNFDFDASMLAGKAEALLLMPALLAGTIALFLGLTVIEPRRQNLLNSAPLWLVGWIGCTAAFAVQHISVVHGALTGATTATNVMPFMVSVLLIVGGNYFAKSRSNWVSSFPIPWALESEHAWTLSSRVRGWCLVLTGVAGLFSIALYSDAIVRMVIFGGVIASFLVGMVVAYLAWRDDPERAG